MINTCGNANRAHSTERRILGTDGSSSASRVRPCDVSADSRSVGPKECGRGPRSIHGDNVGTSLVGFAKFAIKSVISAASTFRARVSMPRSADDAAICFRIDGAVGIFGVLFLLGFTHVVLLNIVAIINQHAVLCQGNCE